MGVLLVVLSIAHEYTASAAHFKVLKIKIQETEDSSLRQNDTADRKAFFPPPPKRQLKRPIKSDPETYSR